MVTLPSIECQAKALQIAIRVQMLLSTNIIMTWEDCSSGAGTLSIPKTTSGPAVPVLASNRRERFAVAGRLMRDMKAVFGVSGSRLKFCSRNRASSPEAIE
jgi:hypothetical protein